MNKSPMLALVYHNHSMHMAIPPILNDEEIAAQLRGLRGRMSILKMERESGVSRQVLYRLMGGTSINRSPYELAVKILNFIEYQNRPENLPVGTSRVAEVVRT